MHTVATNQDATTPLFVICPKGGPSCYIDSFLKAKMAHTWYGGFYCYFHQVSVHTTSIIILNENDARGKTVIYLSLSALESYKQIKAICECTA